MVFQKISKKKKEKKKSQLMAQSFFESCWQGKMSSIPVIENSKYSYNIVTQAKIKD